MQLIAMRRLRFSSLWTTLDLGMISMAATIRSASSSVLVIQMIVNRIMLCLALEKQTPEWIPDGKT